MRIHLPRASLTCVLGQSGAGKTSLLNILSGKGAGHFVGTMALAGVGPVTVAQLRRCSSFVPQDDIMHDSLTPREQLTYYARLRRPAEPAAATAARVEALLARLGLGPAADVRVGNPVAPGISGGQRKRLSVGMELLDSPSLLALDEPTSGLDSRAQVRLAAFLRSLRDGDGVTVVATVHSPGAAVFLGFDQAIVLASHLAGRTGSLAYHGSVRQAAGYFAMLGSPPPSHGCALRGGVRARDSRLAAGCKASRGRPRASPSRAQPLRAGSRAKRPA